MTDAIRVETISKQRIDAERRKSDTYTDEVFFIRLLDQQELLRVGEGAGIDPVEVDT